MNCENDANADTEYSRQEAKYAEQKRKAAETNKRLLAEALRFVSVPEYEKRHYLDDEGGFYDSFLERLNRAIAASGIGKRHDKDVGRGCEPWVKCFDALRDKLGTGFLYVLIGNRGTGKTQLASDLCRYTIENKKFARWITVMNLFLKVRATFKGGNATEESVIESFVEPSLLVLDEVQERTGSEFESRLLTQLVDERYRQQRDTLLIGNLLSADVAATLGPSIVSRANECGGVIVADWPSFREKQEGEQ